ncbi:MAG: ribulose-phosphate 3-epimerase [Thermoflexales bacterium]|nr:ribulose-phosphate 3-epimerase [Thermoflexales bacterium]
MSTQIKIAPSILAADFTRLGEQITQAEAGGADYIHVDVMDGRFVPNITVGPLVVEAACRSTSLPLDVHLMIVEPEHYLERFARAGANILTVHVETCPHLHRTIQQIHELGCRAGVTLNPATPLWTIEEIVPDIDLLLVMTVNSGFGGQAFIERMLSKIEQARALLDKSKPSVELEVDGGISPRTSRAVVRAGARVLVAGSAIFTAPQGVAEAIRQIRAAADEG